MNYSFAVNSTYDPFTFQELLTPYVMYKEAFDKNEEAYNELSNKADVYSYLGQQLEGQDSKAAQIYKGYADDLHKQAADFAKHGLNMSNRRALTNLKRRYAGEIGRLDLANTALEEERKLRRTMNAKDNSLLYANDNLSIDDFLDNGTPNLYNVSGNELYKRGVAAGTAASSRNYSAGDNGSTLGGYYRDWVERNGYSKESMDAFRANIASIPELQQAVDGILAERGVTGNLSGANLNRARQSVINGIIDGAVYQEKHNPVRDEGKMSAAQSASLAMERERLNLSAASSGMTKVNGRWIYNPSRDPATMKALAMSGNRDASGTLLFPTYDKRTRISGGGQDIDDSEDRAKGKIPSNATKVNVEIKDGKYVLTAGNGADKIKLGEISGSGDFKLGDFNGKQFSRVFGPGVAPASVNWIPYVSDAFTAFGNWVNPGAGYDKDRDPANIEALARDVLEVAQREGPQGFKNYNYYLESDNSDNFNDNGAFWRDPLTRAKGTNASGFSNDFTGGYGD